MPPELRKAHQRLDAAVDALYKRGGQSGLSSCEHALARFAERVEHLFAVHEKLADPLLARAGKDKRTRRLSRTDA